MFFYKIKILNMCLFFILVLSFFFEYKVMVLGSFKFDRIVLLL